MSDVSLVPVDHQPDFEDVSLVPVDHDPFSADGVTPQAQSQQTQSQPAQPPPQQPATGVERLYVSPPANNTQASEIGEAWNPNTENDDASGPNRWAASTPAQAKPAYDWSHFNQPFGELKPATFTPTQQIGYLTADALMAAGMQPYDANHLTNGIGGLLGLTPLGVVGSALDLIDAKRRDDFPGGVAAAVGMIPGAKGVGRVGAEEAGAGLRALTGAVRRTPASRAAEKGFSGIGTTRNGGPTFAGTDHLYPAEQGQQSAVEIGLTGSRKDDFKRANEVGGFTKRPDGYTWHHVDDFNPQTGTSSLELVQKGAHEATYPHAGSVSQYEKFHGTRYKR